MRQNILLKRVYLLFFLLTTSLGLFAQEISISGIVSDQKDGSPITGATVIVKGTTIGTTTNFEGKYTIKSTRNSFLVFSFIGYEVQEIAVDGRTQIDITLTEQTVSLEEIVVVGYGTQRKRNMTGSVSKVGGEDLASVPIPSFEAGLQGKATGVQIIQSSGMAGAGSAIRIRGVGSISAGGDPLIVVDGVPIVTDNGGERRGYNTNGLATINPNDIESVEVLKDASAAAIYGSRGANGVILITTKRGKTSKPKIDLSFRTGISQETKRLDLVNNLEWLQLAREAYENDAIYGTGDISELGAIAALPGGVTLEQAMATNTDWQAQMFHKGKSNEVNLSYSQGTEKIKTYIGLSLSDQESFLIGDRYQRASSRVNLDFKPTKSFSIGTNAMLSQGINDRVEASWAGGLGEAQSTALPIWPVWINDSTYFSGGANPVRIRDNRDIKTFETRTIANLYAKYALPHGVSVQADGGVDYLDMDETYFNNEVISSPTYGQSKNHYILNWNAKLLASYDLQLIDKHDFTFLLATEASKTEIARTFYSYNGITAPVYETKPDTSLLGSSVFDPTESFAFLSFISRVNYSFLKKYLINASFRVDGSSRFGVNNRFGYFPAASVGWIVSEEDFLKGNKVISFLKLKTGIGYTGNAEIPNYAQYGTTSAYNNGIIYNNNPIMYQINLENPDIGWEKSISYDIGFEFGLLSDRIQGEFAYYNKQTRDMLLQVKVQASSGWEQAWKNIGSMENKGVEFNLTSHNIVGEFKWTTNFNIGFNKNKVLDVGSSPPDALAGTGDTRVVVGHPIGVNYLVKFLYVDPADGMPVFEKPLKDEDGNIIGYEETKIYTPDDRQIVGKPYPDFIGGLNNSLSWKGIDFSFLFTFSYGNDIYDDAGKRHMGRISGWNVSRAILDRWRQPGDVTDVPRLTMDGSLSGIEVDRNTTEFLYDGSFIRLKNMTLGYTLPTRVSKKAYIQSARLYFVASNILTFTNYPGADPEIFRDMENVMQKNLSPSVTYLTPPQAQTFSFGIDLTF